MLVDWRSAALRAGYVVLGGGVALMFAHGVFGLDGSAPNALVDKWLYTGLELAAVGICIARVVRRRRNRLAWALIAAGLASWTAGDLVWTLWLDNLANPPSPSLADAFYLPMFPLIYGALVLFVRSEARRSGAAAWLDGAVVGLAVASVGGVLVLPVVLKITGGDPVAVAVNLAYPLFDLVLLFFMAMVCALLNWRPGRGWVLLGSGIAIKAVADMVFVYQAAHGVYLTSVLDAFWPLAMVLCALGAWQPTARRRSQTAGQHTIAIPMVAGLVALGVLVLSDASTATAPAIVCACAAVLLTGVRAAIAHVEGTRMLQRAAHDAVTDALTGLSNRRHLMSDLEDAAATGRVATLAFFDLNGFKRYNDSFGHAAGDALLARLGASLLLAVGPGDAVYRPGGDEFCILFRGRRERASAEIHAAAMALTESGRAFTITPSCGVATFPSDAPTVAQLLRLADQRMYAEKVLTARPGDAQTHSVLMQLLRERAPALHSHVHDVGQLTAGIGRKLGLDSEALDELLRAAELHDVGKLAVPDRILEKPGPLDGEEWAFMRQHPVIGERILNAAQALQPVARLVRGSHERWDGHGYPDRLAGEQIPLGARIITVCDAFEAMTSERVYKPALSSSLAIAQLRANAGTQFDPRVVSVFCEQFERAEAERRALELLVESDELRPPARPAVLALR